MAYNEQCFVQIEEILLGEGFKESAIKHMRNAYNEPHRFYHNNDHLQDLCTKIHRSPCINDSEKALLLIAAGYHDIVYDPKSKTNEKDSLEFFIKDAKESKYFNEEPLIKIVSDIITSTASREKPKEYLAKTFWEFDNDILLQPFNVLLGYELKIYKEFQFVDYPTYVRERTDFLIRESIHNENEHLSILADFVKGRRPSVGLYPGSFDPFHKGHLNILEKAERMFDKVIIVKGHNPDKTGALLDSILRTPQVILNRQIIEWDGLTTDLMKNISSHSEVTLIRGLRDGKDLDYEINQLRFMEDMYKDLNVCFIHCDKEFEHISSSAIKKINTFSHTEALKYLP